MPRKRRILGEFRFICQSDRIHNDSRNPAHILEAHFLLRWKYRKCDSLKQGEICCIGAAMRR